MITHFLLPQQSLSSIIDHDPDQDTILTATKILSLELSHGNQPSEEAPCAQLSATKLPKHIKNE